MHSNLAPHQQFLNVERNSDDWITGTEPMTLEQRIYLKNLCQEVGEIFDGTLSKASASERIKLLQEKIGKKL